MQKNYKAFIYLIICLFIVGNNYAQFLNQTQKIFASDGDTYQKFGFSLAVSENYLVAGAPGQANVVGATYIFYKNAGSWTQISKLAPSTEPGTSFGCAVGISHNQIIIGERRKDNIDGDDDTGMVYVYEANNGTWTNQKLDPGDLISGNTFGSSISANENYLLIGAPNEYFNGSVYLYKNNNGNWEKEQKVDNNLSGGRFGFSSAMIDGYALIGAPYEASVYLYKFENDRLVDPVILSYGTRQALFGYDLDLNKDFLFVTAPLSDENGPDSGSVFVFSKVNGFWTQHQLLFPDNSGQGDIFGSSILVRDNYLYIGARGQSIDNAVESGSVYIYYNNNGTWEQIGKITASDAFYNMQYGSALATNSSEIVVGAPHRAEGIKEFTGASYIYSTSTLSVSEKELNSTNLFPNPVSNNLIIESKLPITKVEIYTVLGQKVKVVNSDFNSISTENLSRGIYMIKIYSEKGSTVRKLIKE